jgi:hypothetical protein
MRLKGVACALAVVLTTAVLAKESLVMPGLKPFIDENAASEPSTSSPSKTYEAAKPTETKEAASMSSASSEREIFKHMPTMPRVEVPQKITKDSDDVEQPKPNEPKQTQVQVSNDEIEEEEPSSSGSGETPIDEKQEHQSQKEHRNDSLRDETVNVTKMGAKPTSDEADIEGEVESSDAKAQLEDDMNGQPKSEAADHTEDDVKDLAKEDTRDQTEHDVKTDNAKGRQWREPSENGEHSSHQEELAIESEVQDNQQRIEKPLLAPFAVPERLPIVSPVQAEPSSGRAESPSRTRTMSSTTQTLALPMPSRTGSSRTDFTLSSVALMMMPTSFEMRPVPATRLHPNYAVGEAEEGDDGEEPAEGYFTATRASQFLGPNGLLSEAAEIVRMPASLRAFKSCIYGCSSVTVPASTGGSTVVVVLPFTIPCSLVSCPPCTTCVSSTVAVTVCPVVSTVTPSPIRATVLTYNRPSSSRCSGSVVTTTESVTVTRTRMPLGCPVIAPDAYAKNDDGTEIAPGQSARVLPFTYQVDQGPESVCSSFVVCSPRHFTCPACQLGKTVDLDSVISLLNHNEPTLSTTMTLTAQAEADEPTAPVKPEAAKRKLQSSARKTLRVSYALLALVMLAVPLASIAF